MKGDGPLGADRNRTQNRPDVEKQAAAANPLPPFMMSFTIKIHPLPKSRPLSSHGAEKLWAHYGPLVVNIKPRPK